MSHTCIICLDDIEPIKCMALQCCANLIKTGESKKICYSCTSLFYIEYQKKKALNPNYKAKCPHCTQIASLEFLDNMKIIYMKIFTDEERQQLEDLYKTIRELNQNTEIEEQSIQQAQQIQIYQARQMPIFEIEEYKNYVKLCKEHSKKERINKQRVEAKIRDLKKYLISNKYDDDFKDKLITKYNICDKELLKLCGYVEHMKKQNPKIFTKKSNFVYDPYHDDDYNVNDFYDF